MIRAVLMLLVLAWSGRAAAQLEEPGAAGEVSPTHSSEALESALLAFAHEPTVDEVVGWTLEASTVDPRAASDAIDRARFSGLLPELRVGVRRGLGWDWASRQSMVSDTSSLASGEDLSLLGTAVFRLDRLLAPAEETGLIRERRTLEVARTELAARTIAIYFERRRLQIEAMLTGTTTVESLVRIQELSALLDVLTGGQFSAALSPA